MLFFGESSSSEDTIGDHSIPPPLPLKMDRTNSCPALSCPSVLNAAKKRRHHRQMSVGNTSELNKESNEVPPPPLPPKLRTPAEDIRRNTYPDLTSYKLVNKTAQKTAARVNGETVELKIPSAAKDTLTSLSSSTQEISKSNEGFNASTQIRSPNIMVGGEFSSPSVTVSTISIPNSQLPMDDFKFSKRVDFDIQPSPTDLCNRGQYSTVIPINESPHSLSSSLTSVHRPSSTSPSSLSPRSINTISKLSYLKAKPYHASDTSIYHQNNLNRSQDHPSNSESSETLPPYEVVYRQPPTSSLSCRSSCILQAPSSPRDNSKPANEKTQSCLNLSSQSHYSDDIHYHNAINSSNRHSNPAGRMLPKIPDTAEHSSNKHLTRHSFSTADSSPTNALYQLLLNDTNNALILGRTTSFKERLKR